MANPDSTDAVDLASLASFDMLIDARSPGEFAEDHLPGAINLPVLDNEERAIVGTIYVQESRFKARRIGAALVARNVARHLETTLADMGPDFKPLVYCWRGGQRSNSMALILAQVGWRTLVLKGGYKTWRRSVQRRLYDEPLGRRLVLVDGGTGCAKTDILVRMRGQGAQVIDLEGLAAHRGSLFGAYPDRPQPSQKWFESLLQEQLERMDPTRPVFVKAESNKIGDRTLPPAVWQAMQDAPRVEVIAPLVARATYLAEAYPDIIADRARMDEALTRLEVYPGRKQLANWRELADAGDYHGLISDVVERHYDPTYDRSRRRHDRPKLGEVRLETLSETDRDMAAAQVIEIAGKALGGV